MSDTSFLGLLQPELCVPERMCQAPEVGALVNQTNGNSNTSNMMILDEDTDFDGLTDEEEVILGTKLDEPDTDEDGLDDGEEIELGTNPLNPDTNGDGYSDYVEVKGYDEGEI